jgi:prephenate dehydrogenase
MRIAVIGAGKMGSWLAGELAKECEVAVYDRHPERAKAIKGARHLAGLAELGAFSPEVLLNAVSLQNTVAAFEEAAPHLPRECVLCDVASVKGDIPKYYRRCGFAYASLHPMFGPTSANVESLADENVIIISESEPKTAEFFRRFFSARGLSLFEYSFAEHDGAMAYSLTLPFASSLVFAACMDAKAVPGSTFKKHRKIARGLLSEDDRLLAEILFNPCSVAEIEKVNSRLEFLKHVIRGRDFDEAVKFFEKLRRNVG